MPNIFELYQKLFPTGHAWKLQQQKIFTAVMESKAIERERFKSDLLINLSDLFPYTTEIIDEWAHLFGFGDDYTDDEKRDLVFEKWFETGNITAGWLEFKIQSAGFTSVYVHRNLFKTVDDMASSVNTYGNGQTYGSGISYSKPILSYYSIDPAPIINDAASGVQRYGGGDTYGSGLTYATGGKGQLCVDFIEPAKEWKTVDDIPDKEDLWQHIFFVTKANFPDPIQITNDELLKLREIIIKNKPLNSWCIIVTTT